MAVDVCSEISSTSSAVIISPRISFSYDLNSQQAADDLQDITGSETAGTDQSEFFFSIISPSKCLHEPCLADEIFSNGKILPTQIKKKNSAGVTQHVSVVAEPNKIRLKELLEIEVEDDDEEEHQKPAEGKSFWKFRRSNSLNCDFEAKGVLKTIQLLTRSKSTSSVPNPKQSRIPKKTSKVNNESDKSQFRYYGYGASTTMSSRQKPPLGRTKFYGSGNVRISPVLNIPLPPSYFCSGNAASLFGFGSLFCSGKDKSKKKKALS